MEVMLCVCGCVCELWFSEEQCTFFPGKFLSLDLPLRPPISRRGSSISFFFLVYFGQRRLSQTVP